MIKSGTVLQILKVPLETVPDATWFSTILTNFSHRPIFANSILAESKKKVQFTRIKSKVKEVEKEILKNNLMIH